METAPQRPIRSRPDMPEWRLTVIEAHDIAPAMRRVVLGADNLGELNYLPGQALILRMPLPDGTTGRRDYTIRWFDREARRLAIDFVLHGSTPAPSWARSVKAGDTIVAQGPRGRTTLNLDADWHLFCGDETAVPAILHMLEGLPKGARAFAFVEIGSTADEMPVQTPGDLTLEWIHRGEHRPGPGTLLLDRLGAFQFPEGRGHAYLIGETSNIRALRHHLVGRGFERSQIASEGYWRPGRIGGHDHVDD
jgi:NADPH-dependent ferric siderophore reductase